MLFCLKKAILRLFLLNLFYFTFTQKNSVREVRRTCPASFQNVRRRAAVKFNQMSGEKVQMSGEAKKDFAYTGQKRSIVPSLGSLGISTVPDKSYKQGKCLF